jgi:hypothetical protein
MEDKNLDWPVLSMGKALEKFGGHPCPFIDLRKFRFRKEKEVSISGFSGLLRNSVEKDDNGAGYGGIMIKSNDCQIQIAFNDSTIIDNFIDILEDVKKGLFTHHYKYQLKENVQKDNQI